MKIDWENVVGGITDYEIEVIEWITIEMKDATELNAQDRGE